MKKPGTVVLAGVCLLAALCWWFRGNILATGILTITSRTPIAFYGRVVDQRGSPIAGVKATAGVEAVTHFMENHQDQYSTMTNSDGRFQFTSLHGQNLGIYLSKVGYEFKSTLKRYEYSIHTPETQRHHPDRSAPEVFTMWKLKGAEPLVHVEFNRVFVPVDGTPTSFDLLTGKKVPSGGDLTLRVERQPLHIHRGEHFDWKATIEVPDGGIVEQHDVYPNEAPVSGYEGQYAIEMPATSKVWYASVTRTFYVKARDAKLYARIRFKIIADYEPPPTNVTMEAYVNPSGSRNLEYDPAKEVLTRQ